MRDSALIVLVMPDPDREDSDGEGTAECSTAHLQPMNGAVQLNMLVAKMSHELLLGVTPGDY